MYLLDIYLQYFFQWLDLDLLSRLLYYILLFEKIVLTTELWCNS